MFDRFYLCIFVHFYSWYLTLLIKQKSFLFIIIDASFSSPSSSSSLQAAGSQRVCLMYPEGKLRFESFLGSWLPVLLLAEPETFLLILYLICSSCLQGAGNTFFINSRLLRIHSSRDYTRDIIVFVDVGLRFVGGEPISYFPGGFSEFYRYLGTSNPNHLPGPLPKLTPCIKSNRPFSSRLFSSLSLLLLCLQDRNSFYSHTPLNYGRMHLSLPGLGTNDACLLAASKRGNKTGKERSCSPRIS